MSSLSEFADYLTGLSDEEKRIIYELLKSLLAGRETFFSRPA